MEVVRLISTAGRHAISIDGERVTVAVDGLVCLEMPAFPSTGTRVVVVNRGPGDVLVDWHMRTAMIRARGRRTFEYGARGWGSVR